MPPYGALVALSAPWVALRCGVDAAMRAGGGTNRARRAP